MSFHVVFMMGYLVVDAVYSKALLLEVDEEDGYSDSSSGGKAVNFFFSLQQKKDCKWARLATHVAYR